LPQVHVWQGVATTGELTKRCTDGILVLDPKEGMKVVHAALNYDNAKDRLLEDEYTRVEGRMERE